MNKNRTPFQIAEDRLVAQFAAEAEGLGLKADVCSRGGHYGKDGTFILELHTLPEPLKGNKAKVEALRAAGYAVWVYEPYGWNKRRGFSVRKTFPVIVPTKSLEFSDILEPVDYRPAFA